MTIRTKIITICLCCLALYCAEPRAEGLSIGIQCFWLIWIAASANYGFLPLCCFLFVVYARNHRKWTRAAQSPTPGSVT